jgi:hypothetical protein
MREPDGNLGEERAEEMAFGVVKERGSLSKE